MAPARSARVILKKEKSREPLGERLETIKISVATRHRDGAYSKYSRPRHHHSATRYLATRRVHAVPRQLQHRKARAHAQNPRLTQGGCGGTLPPPKITENKDYNFYMAKLRFLFFSVFLLHVFYGVFAGGSYERGGQEGGGVPISDTLTIAHPKQQLTFNFVKSISVFESTLYTALYNGLVTADPRTLQPRVGLAVSWFVSEDKKTYTFNLRKNARFSDGSYVTAEDVRASWLASIQAKTPFAYLFYSIEGVTDYVNGTGTVADIGITVLSDRVLQVRLTHPINYFLKVISHSAFSVTSRFQIAAQDWDTSPNEILYSGAYVVESASDDEIILVKNPYFWGKENVQIEKIVAHLYDSTNAKAMFDAFQKGDIQWLDPSNEITSEQVAEVDKKMVQSFSVFGTTYLFFKASDEPWTHASVRKALQLLLPLDKLLPKLYSFAAKSLVPEISGVYSSVRKTIPSEDTKTAYELLETAGYPKGAGLPPLVILVPSDKKGTYAQIFTEIKTALEKALELEVVIKPILFENYYAALQSEEFVIGSNNWVGDFADPMAFLQMWMYENKSIGHYYDEESFRAIIEQSFVLSGNERQAILQKAERQLLNSGIVLPLHHLYALELVRTDLLKGWVANPLNTPNFAALSFASEQSIPYIIYNQKYHATPKKLLVKK